MSELRDLIERCLVARDTATESVIADWCEEHGFDLHAEALRGGAVAEALRHLRHWVGDAAPPLEPALYLDALALFRVCEERRWVTEAERVLAPDNWFHSATFAAPSYVDGQVLEKATHRRVEELTHPTLLHYRQFPTHETVYGALREVHHRPCPTCGAPAVTLIHTDHSVEMDEPSEIHVHALCLRAPHLTRIAS